MTDFFWPELPPSPRWHVLAACDGTDEDGTIFFPEHGHSAARAKAICARCPVVEQCLEWAIQHEDSGVWGGTTAPERVELRRARRVA
ncbi:MAG: WhiB family transcriptional regulator [Actinobacteria bacterium]|nr:WhiB family transcriptional regulator [Actinomycetota bacterium]